MKPSYIIAAAAALALAAIAASATLNPPPRVIWNASASVPIGYYAVAPANDFEIGDLLVVAPPPDIADYLDERGYVPNGVPLLKQVAALPGQQVCRHGLTVSVSGTVIGSARLRDRSHRPLPIWQGCHTLTDQQIFLMNAAAPDSLDGRYFGPLDRTAIVGQATPIWVDRDGDGELAGRDCCNFSAPDTPKKENDDVTNWNF